MSDGTGTTPKKWAGKYDSPEELEKGMLNFIPAFEQIKAEAERSRQEAAEYKGKVELLTEALMTTQAQPQATVGYDDQDPRAYIDARFAQVDKTLKSLPDMLDARLKAVIEPITQVQNAQGAYMAENPDYDPGNIQKFLAVNPGINKTYQAILATGPENAGQAFRYAHDSFRNSLPKTSSVDEGRKRDAAVPKNAVPAAPEIPGEGPSAEALANKATWAQTWGGPDAELEFMKEYFKGSNVAREVEAMKPDWARE